MFITRLTLAVAGTLLIGLTSSAPGLAQEQQQVDSARLSQGASAWARQCQRCHNLRDPKELEDYEWDVSVNHMRVRGNIPGDLAEDIKYFLKHSN